MGKPKTIAQAAHKIEKKVLHKEVKAVRREIAHAVPKPAHLKRAQLAPVARAAVNRGDKATKAYLSRFSHRDAMKMAWMAMVLDPWHAPIVPIPLIIATGASPACPRMYSVELTGFMVTTTGGRGYIGANADGWITNFSASAGSAPTPQYLFLGNSSTYGARGYPVHYTDNTYNGCAPLITGSTVNSYPGPGASVAAAVTGLKFLPFPNNFISTQTDCAAGAGNAFQTFSNVATSLRCRPVSPASGALVYSGEVIGIQQILGDTVVTNPAAASTSSAVGGADCYAYVAGLTNSLAAGVSPLAEESIARTRWDMGQWPTSKDGTKNWMTISAIPNQRCSFGQWTPGNTGASVVGYPQVAFITGGGVVGQSIEFEAKYVYAFYGGISYEATAGARNPRLPASDLASTLAAGTTHAKGANLSGKHAAAMVAQEAVDTGRIVPSQAADWIKSGSDIVTAATGSSVGDIIGDVLGGIGAMLF